MVVRPRSTRLPSLLLAALGGGIASLGACAGGPDVAEGPRIEHGRRTTVRYVQFASGQMFTLQNASSGAAREIYSDEKRDRTAKVVGDGELQALIDILTEQGLLQHATGAAAPDAREALVVEFPDRRWIWSPVRRAGHHDAAFHDSRGYFLALYNGAVAFHGNAEHDGAPPDLKGQQERIQRDAAIAREKLLRLGRPQ